MAGMPGAGGGFLSIAVPDPPSLWYSHSSYTLPSTPVTRDDTM